MSWLPVGWSRRASNNRAPLAVEVHDPPVARNRRSVHPLADIRWPRKPAGKGHVRHRLARGLGLQQVQAMRGRDQD